ncbi:MAG: ABC transporter related protein, partial [Parcubacteria group bacterium GW2011_GWF2_44_7]
MRDKSSNIKYPDVSFKDVAVSFWQVTKKNWLSMILTIAGVAVASVFEIIIPLFYKRFFDLLSSGQDKNILAPQMVHTLLIILSLYGCVWFFWRFGSFATVYFQANVMANLRRQAFDYLVGHSYSFFANNFTGALVQRVGRYARAFERLADRLTWNFLPIMVRLTGITIVLSTFEPRLAFIVLGWAFFYIFINYLYSLWRLKYNIKMAAADSRTTAVLADAVSNQNNIEVFNQYASEKKNFKEVVGDQKKITMANWNVGNGLDAIQSALIILIEFFVLYYTIRYWQAGLVTIGTFVLIQLYILGLGSRLWEFSRIIRDVYESYADAKEMVEIMKLPYEIKDTPLAKPLAVAAGEVAFQEVNFAFNQTRLVLKNINLTVKAGEKIALVGPSGAGKTTFIRLLLRFYDVADGKILIDGQNIQKVTLASLRDNISLVPQDPLLFHRTIRENIRYGRPTATDQEVEEAGRLA